MIRTTVSLMTACFGLYVASVSVTQITADERPLAKATPPKARAKFVSAPFVFAFPLDEKSGGSAFDDLTGEPSTKPIDDTDLFGPATPEKTTDSDTTTTTETTKSEATKSETTRSETPQSGISTETNTATAANLSPELIVLRERVRNCLGHYYQTRENVVVRSPWGVMHALIAYGVDTEIYANSKQVNAIGWLCWNGNCRGQQLFYTEEGKLKARLGDGVQGHAGQFLAMMAQCRVKPNYPMSVDGQQFTIADLIEHEKLTCEAGTELTFKLIGLSHYLDSEARWKNQRGEDWNIQRLIKEELAQPIVGAACGGTHRLMGFNYAVRKREKEGKPLVGQWTRAKKYLDDYFEYTYFLQNEDGSFSTDFFRGRNGYGDINRRIETTGHILEWFVASLTDEQLRDPRVIKSVKYLTDLMLENRDNEWEIGPKGHALHALAIYSERVFNDKPGQRAAVLARGRKVNAIQPR